jgi:DNA (cytosine-5)-methyltransferase 1
MKVGSLFSGYGGLDLAVEEVYGATTVWHSELDKHASKVLAHHWPDVPNLGDITAVDWADVEPVDIVCGGFPCQDISSAGLGRGITEGTRSGLWYVMADAVRHLRPRLVVVENVSALLVRGIDIVLGDLAVIGYDAQWVSVRASDVGAPHRRQRVFLTAHPQGSRGADEPIRGDAPRLTVGPVARAGGRARPGDPAPGVHRGGRPAGLMGVAPDAGGQRHGRGQDPRLVGRLDREDAPDPRERQRPRQVAGDRGAADAADTDGAGPQGRDTLRQRPGKRATRPSGMGDPEWGPYAAAVHRWEPIVGRAAPLPTDDRGRLSPVFAEWMMGLDEGWVTDHLDRRPALKALGNGVVPQQAAHGLRLLERVAACFYGCEETP